MRRARFSFLVLAVLSSSALADRLIVPHVPHSYVVRRGDTLWGIATHFLHDPWRWPGIWNQNLQIKNPDLIYPGDTIVLRYAKGRPYLVDVGPKVQVVPEVPQVPGGAPSQGRGLSRRITVLRPQVRAHALVGAIPTLSPNVIGPFLQRPLALSRRALRHLGYVAGSVHHHTFLSSLSRFYGRHLPAHPAKMYDIYRRGPSLHDQNGHFLAYETKYVGRAKLIHAGRLPEFEVLSSVREVEDGDRLVPWTPHPPIPYYYPRAPHKPMKGAVVAATHDDLNLGTYAAIAVNIGKNVGMRRGYVLRIYSKPHTFYDPVAHETVRGRSQPIGLIMIFRTFSKVSYGVIMETRREIHVGDLVSTP